MAVSPEFVGRFGVIVMQEIANARIEIIHSRIVEINVVHRKIQKMNVGKTGFTLVELLVVIAILSILSVVGLGSFQSSQAKGRDAQRKQDLGQIQRALEMYYNDYEGYPLAVGFGATWEDTKGTIYMKTVPNDPKGGSYCYESDGTYYKLYVKLENLQDSKRITPDSTTCPEDDGYNYGVSSSNIAP